MIGFLALLVGRIGGGRRLAGAAGPGGNGGILLETSGYVLLEDGGYMLME